MIVLYCTNRGRHNPIDLYRLHAVGADQVGLEDFHGSNDVAKMPRLGSESLRCWLCPRRPKWTVQRARRIVDGAVRDGLTALDLSYLD